MVGKGVADNAVEQAAGDSATHVSGLRDIALGDLLREAAHEEEVQRVGEYLQDLRAGAQ